VLCEPENLSRDVLTSALAAGWGLAAVSLTYLPVGWGSHHWKAVDDAGTAWFVTADDLGARQWSGGEPADGTFARLRASLAAALDLRATGVEFVLAPVPARDGEPLMRANEQFSLAVYPYVMGESSTWGEFTSPEQRRGMLDLVVATHAAPAAARRRAGADDFVLQARDALEAALSQDGAGREEAARCGPYGRPAALLAEQHAAAVRSALARYDELAAECGDRPPGEVLTHGEPHPGNIMLTGDGWRLIDWDTALVAPPERDLWDLDPGDGSLLAGYTAATGVTLRPRLLELYRIRWDLTDIALGVRRFCQTHRGNAEDDKEWSGLCSLVAGLAEERAPA
jgi:spectinomycin phosphotransferase/16S rRNA (guanine(1405)-N(7))-methyltransferase